MAKKSEELTKLAIEIAGLKVKAEVLEAWPIVDILDMAYSSAIVGVRVAMEEDDEEE